MTPDTQSTDLCITFFLGTNRTGTMALTRFFEEWFPQTSACHQLGSHKVLNVLSSIYVERRISRNAYEYGVRNLLTRRLARLPPGIHIETNGWNYVAARSVLELYPHARVVHIVRNPGDFVPSYLTWINSRWKSYVAYNWLPFWMVDAAAVGAMSREEWLALDDFGRLCWMWTFRNEYIENTYASFDGRYHFVRFEDLVDSSNRARQKRVLKALLEFIGLGFVEGCERFFDRKINASRRGTDKAWQQLDAEKRHRLQQLCGELMQRYGYGVDTQ